MREVDQPIWPGIGFPQLVGSHGPYISPFSYEERRGNFQGYLIKTMTGHSRPKVLVDKSSSILDIKSQTYDVTKSVEGYHMEILYDMQKYLNFSSTLHEREDGTWGSEE